MVQDLRMKVKIFLKRITIKKRRRAMPVNPAAHRIWCVRSTLIQNLFPTKTPRGHASEPRGNYGFGVVKTKLEVILKIIPYPHPHGAGETGTVYISRITINAFVKIILKLVQNIVNRQH